MKRAFQGWLCLVALAAGALGACSGGKITSSDATPGASSLCSGCSIDGVCYAEGTTDPTNACAACIPEESKFDWSGMTDDAACDDGVFCNGPDSCQAGSCEATGTEPCGDGIDCNGEETCSEDSKTCSLAQATCNDGTLCNLESDSCEVTCAGCAVSGVCYPAGANNPENPCEVCAPEESSSSFSAASDGTACDDGTFCNGTDTCQSGACTAPDINPCDDSVSCNGTESCNEESDSCGPGASTCDAGTFCDTALNSCELTCDGCLIAGSCYAEGAVNPANTCEACEVASSATAFTARTDGSLCSDGLFCNGVDTCQAGACTALGINPCDDSVSCNGTESCNEETNRCGAGTSACGAGTFCDAAQDSCELTCDGCLIAGSCYAEGAVNPANTCEACEVVSSATSFTARTDGSLCSDGLFCNGLDTCQSGTCTAPGSSPCDDSVSCNGTESCNETTDSCIAGASSCRAGTSCDTALDSCEATCAGCLVGGVCYAQGTAHPASSCQICDTAQSTTAFVSAVDDTDCGYNAACSSGICGCEQGWVDVDGYCSLEVIAADDEVWSGTVYTGFEAQIPLVNLLANDIYNLGEDSELNIVGVQNPVNGVVSLVGGNVNFTGTNPGAGSFTYLVQVGSDASTQVEVVVTLTVTAAPSVIALDDSLTVQQGDTLPISASGLLSNDVGTNLTVTAVSAPVGGTVSLVGSTINFVSTGISGEPAQFTYTIENDSFESAAGTVYITATPLPPLVGYVFEDIDLFNSFSSTYSPPTVLSIFNTWGRFNHNDYWADGSLATSAAASWTLIGDEDGDLNIDGDLDGDTVDDNQTSFNSGGYTVNGDVDGNGTFDPRFMQVANGTFNGFVSPDSYDAYNHEVTLWSMNSDDDMVGALIAYDSGGASGTLHVDRTKGGVPPYSGWGLMEGYTVIAELNIDGTSGGWSGAASRVKVVRDGDLIQVYCTPWMTDATAFFSPPGYDPNSLIEIDLGSTTNNITYTSGGSEVTVSRDLTRYQGAKPHGYLNYSQAQSSYIDVEFEGGIVSDVLVYLNNESPAGIFNSGEVWRYSGGVWGITAESVQDVFGFVRTVSEPSTGNQFIIRRDEIELVSP